MHAVDRPHVETAGLTRLDDVRTKLDLDLEYLERKSAWEDFKIMVKTVPVMIFKKGAW